MGKAWKSGEKLGKVVKSGEKWQQNWFVSIATNTMYCSYKTSRQPELYMGEPQCRRHRVALARLYRTGSNNLAVNRHKRELPRNERHCLYCAQNNVYRAEDEFHFIMECPLYSLIPTTCIHVLTIH